MSRILVLGCGLMGPIVAKDCCEADGITQVVGCDIDEEQLQRCTEFVAHEKFESSKLDATDYVALVHKMRGVDVVVNASAAQFSGNVVKAAIRNRVDVVDLTSGNYPLEGELYKETKEAGITVIPGCGVDPGLADILAGRGMDLMDEVKEVYFACSGLPQNPQPPLNYKIVFGGKKMPIRPGKVPVIVDGSIVEVDRYSEVEPVKINGFEDMEAFYDGYPSSLLKVCMEKDVQTFKGKTIRYKGFVDMIRLLLDVGILSEEPVLYKGQKVVPLDFFQKLVYPMVRFDPEEDRDVTILLVKVKGKKDNSSMFITYEMIDFYDEQNKITSMAKTTGYTAAIVAQMLSEGKISKKGIQWPVYIIKGNLFTEFTDGLKKRGVKITENVSKTEQL